MNLSNTIIPRSDQLNADDLIAGPRTITITGVESGSAEQPVTVRYQGDNGRPYKPSKSMRRVLVSLWGTDGNAYIGRRLTLYRDPGVKFGGEPIGGIKISHASEIRESVQIALTETRGRRKPHRVDPLPDEKPEVDLQALSDVGASKAREGVAALQAWWATLPNPAKHALKTALVDWKQVADAAQTKDAA